MTRSLIALWLLLAATGARAQGSTTVECRGNAIVLDCETTTATTFAAPPRCENGYSLLTYVGTNFLVCARDLKEPIR